MESLRQNKHEELEKILKQKEIEKTDLENMTNVYERHAIDELEYSTLKELEEKIMKSLDVIKIRKEKCNLQL